MTPGRGRSFLLALGLGWLAVAVLAGGVSCNEVTGVSDIWVGYGGGGGGGPVPTDEPCAQDGAWESCYSGPPTTRGIGPCSDGSRLCMAGFWSQCMNAIVPVDEICDDNLDNDCDGASDEGCPCPSGTSRECYSGPPITKDIGECQGGTQQCVNEVWATTCDGEAIPSTEICDGADDNCNGATDDSCICAGMLGQDDCTSPDDLGDVAIGGTVNSPIGQMQTPTDSDWYTVGFPVNSALFGGGTARIELTTGEAAGYRFDVYLACDDDAPQSCGSTGTATDITDWSFVDDQSTAGANEYTTRDVPWPVAAHIRVHRPTGTSCDDYQLAISR